MRIPEFAPFDVDVDVAPETDGAFAPESRRGTLLRHGPGQTTQRRDRHPAERSQKGSTRRLEKDAHAIQSKLEHEGAIQPEPIRTRRYRTASYPASQAVTRLEPGWFLLSARPDRLFCLGRSGRRYLGNLNLG